MGRWVPVRGKQPPSWPSYLCTLTKVPLLSLLKVTKLARRKAWPVRWGHLYLVVWQETQMEGRKKKKQQAFIQHLPSASSMQNALTLWLIQVSHRTANEGMTAAFYISKG